VFVVARFVVLGRMAIAWLAGAERMAWRRFAGWNAAGSVALALTVGGISYAVAVARLAW
jgi:membrane protein DedA with SNARE-associated domain